MDKNMIFLAQQGLTSTSANHVANMAKEKMQVIESELRNISFVNSYVTVIGDVNKNNLHRGSSEKDIYEIEKKLNEISQANSLIAWLREGIKAKEAVIKQVNAVTLKEWCMANGFEYPQFDDNFMVICEDDAIAELNVGERCKYYALQAEASVLGKYVHPDGAYAKARKDLMQRTLNPNEVSGTGRDTLLYSYSPSVSMGDVETVFFNIQKRYREVQAELNGIIHKIKTRVQNIGLEMTNANNEARNEYDATLKKLNGQFNVWRAEEIKKVGELKIIVPNNLSDIYNKVINLEK